MDALLDLFEEDDQNRHEEECINEGRIENVVYKEQRHSSSTNIGKSTDKNQDNYSLRTTNRNSVSISVDERIGIRMINRKICGTDLLDMICEASSNYFSPAQLSSMSLHQLNTNLLVSPTQILDPVNVCGKTNLLTVGIVFSNSGSKISLSSGNAFCILQVGSTLQSGPTVSILMFGSSYSTYCKSLVPGTVIALQNPRLMPMKDSQTTSNTNKSKTKIIDYTTISFTVSDCKQIQIIGTARDYGICNAMISSKNENGKWMSNSKRCTNYIDTRICDYCPNHRNYKQQNSTTNKPVLTTTSTFQQLCNESQLFPKPKNQTSSSMNNMGFPHRNVIAATTSNTVVGTNRVQNNSLPVSFLEQLTAQVNNVITPTNNTTRESPNRNINSVQKRVNLSTNSILNPKIEQTKHPSNLVIIQSVIPAVGTQPCRSNKLVNPYHSFKIPTKTNNPLAFSSPNTTTNVRRNNDAEKDHNVVRTRHVQPMSLNDFIQGKKSTALTTKQPQSRAFTNELEILQKYSNNSNKKHRKQQQSSTIASKTTTTSSCVTTISCTKIINLDTNGFDGSVPVPKPVSSIQRQLNHFANIKSMPSTNQRQQRHFQSIEERQTERAIIQQKRIAEGICNNNVTTDTNIVAKKGTEKWEHSSLFCGMTQIKKQKKDNDNCRRSGGGTYDQKYQQDLFSGSFHATSDSMDYDAILSKTSRFANEVNAEEYVRRRRIVVELEMEEEKKTIENIAPNSKQSSTKNQIATKVDSIIKKEYYCKTCSKMSKQEPTICIGLQHDIVTKRIINETKKGIGEQRQALTEANVENGGLILGSGLEWSTKWKS